MSPDRSKTKVPAAKREDNKSLIEHGNSDDSRTSIVGSLLTAKRGKVPAGSSAPPGISPALYQEIRKFLAWINDPIGLPAYIDYALWQSDKAKLAQLAGLYQKIAQIFNFPT